MIELTEEQLDALEHPESTLPVVVNPRTQEAFVLVPVDEYKRVKEGYDDSPWTRDELESLAWERVKNEDCDDNLPSLVVGYRSSAAVVRA